MRPAGPVPSFVAVSVFAALAALALRGAWNPPLHTYLEYIPIGAVLAALVWDRLFPSLPHRREALWDVLAVALALMRAVIPPFPFVSGHMLLATYGALTARHWPLRALALVVLGHVAYSKVFAGGGGLSMLGGLVVAGMCAILRRRFGRNQLGFS